MYIILNQTRRILFYFFLVGFGALLYGFMASDPCPVLPSYLFTRKDPNMNTDKTIVLNDGRTLGYAEYGAPNGDAVFYFHGGQESRLSSQFMDSTAKSLNIRIIAPDRPGIGLSSYQSYRTFLDWGKDVEQLADALKLKTFSVFGLSGGAPHVLACSYLIPERIVNATIVSGTAPYDYKGKLKGSWIPIRLMHWFAASKKDKNLRKFINQEYKVLLEKPGKRLGQLQKYLPKPDKELMTSKPEYGIAFIRGSLESYRQGIDAVVQEWRMYVRDWGFNLEDIQPHINLWYGEEDKMAPKYKGIYLQQHLPNASLKILDNEGHFSLIRNHLSEILIQLKTPKLITVIEQQ
ncbi:alpha/beta fold hydrolase [Muriicola sp. Z0-33]|uniref:alpha/beta fold hydrolase n=1 Tax=Muriicola sp. Z0-33 TaxID=2816957 RepID=UPI0022381E2C|nr:alpha/beta hydrolase [Muriicola sp. Z0-33]MCW5515298.1 alpha/beta hydrolase [Muriicola sp. Z0-33]